MKPDTEKQMLFKICFTESAEKKPPKLQKLCELPSVQQTLSIQVIGTHLVHVVGVVVLIIVVVQSEGGCAFPGFDDNLVHHRLVGLVTSPLLRYVLLVVHRLLSTLALPVTETQQDSTELSQISDGCVSDKEAVCVCVFSPPALPDAGHVHLVSAEDVKLIVIKHIGSAVQNIWKLLLHWPERTKVEQTPNKANPS